MCLEQGQQEQKARSKNTNPEIKKRGFALISIIETQRERERERETVRIGWIGETMDSIKSLQIRHVLTQQQQWCYYSSEIVEEIEGEETELGFGESDFEPECEFFNGSCGFGLDDEGV